MSDQSDAMTDAEYLDCFDQEFWNILEEAGADALSQLQRDALCVSYFQLEINNGGMHQYLFNSSGDLAAETPDVFRRIGASQVANILEVANAYFGPDGPPKDREARVAALLAFPKDIEDRIYAMSSEFYDLEDAGLSLGDLIDEYVLSQRNNTAD